MKYQPSLALTLVLTLFAATFGQVTSPSAPQRTQDEDDVVRISTNLVQIDAVVTDKNGQQVTDLRPEDFEILEDGRPQKITNLSYISSAPLNASQPEAKAVTPAEKGAPPAPPVRLQPEQVRRTIALVVDDLGLSFESMAYVRQALKKFVDQQMQPGDLVAIIRTAGGMGALQQFTTDKQQLYAAIERVRWYPTGRGGVSAFAPIEANPIGAASLPGAAGLARKNDSSNKNENPTGSATDELKEFREDLFTVGTLGALNFVVRGLRELPGRKSVLLISDGFKLFDPEGGSNRILDALRLLTDLANRASVVIYTMDARGLQTLGLTAADSVGGLTPAQLETRLTDRRSELFDTQTGLIYLAQQTGGFNVRNTNDLSAGIKRVVDDQKGYYLIGYRPDESTFDPKTGQRRFHNISVKVKRSGLKVRSRTGFYGISDEAARQPRRTRAQQLIGALVSPFGASGVKMRLTSLFANDRKEGSFVRSLLYIDASGLSYEDEADGWHKAVVDVMAITFGDNGRVIDQVNRTQTIRVRGATFERVKQYGLVYFLNVPVKKPGAYQLRVAVRDAASERVGSASQFIEVPNLSKKRLALSGIVVNGEDPKAVNKGAAGDAAAAAAPQAGGTAEGASDELDPQAGAAVRRFRQGMVLNFGYLIYNAQLDRASARPQLQTQARLFRDGKPVFTGKIAAFEMGNQTDLERLFAGGRLQLGSELTPGEYVLQVIVTDTLANEKYRTATQWIDFEIVK
jgi:VWFA-related protein